LSPKSIALLASVLSILLGAGTAKAADDSYTNVSGHQIHRPMHSNHVPAGATAHCRDGTYSFSEHHRGTCSHHGGVATWL